jgi:hypothetical protein
MTPDEILDHLDRCLKEANASPPPSPAPYMVIIPGRIAVGFDYTYRFLRHDHPDLVLSKEQLVEYAVRHVARHYVSNHGKTARDIQAYLSDPQRWWEQRRH